MGRVMSPQPGLTPPQFAARAWNFLAVVLVLILAYATWHFSGLWTAYVLAALRDNSHNPDFIRYSTAIAVVALVQAVTTVGVVMLTRRFLPARTAASFGFVAPTAAQMIFATKVAVVLVVVNIVVTALFNLAIGPHTDPYVDSSAGHRNVSWGDYAKGVLTAAVATPIVEETMFRGLLFAGLVQVAPPWLAALVSALIFALWHQDPYRLLPVTVIGLGLAYAYY